MDSTRSSSHLIGGFFGGLTSSVILQPFDLLKTRIQQSQQGTLSSTIKELESLGALWRGTLPSAIRTSVGSALYLSTLNLFRTALAKQPPLLPSTTTSSSSSSSSPSSSSALPKLSTQLNLLTGFLSRAAVGYITMPITIIKVRFESTLYHYTSIAQAVRDIYSKERITGFFRGSGATIARDAPYAGLYVGLYEWWKVTLSKIASSDNSNKMVLLSLNRDANANAHTHTQPLSVSKSAMVNSSAALLSASLATTLTAPFDTIKTRMQLKPGEFRTFVASAVAVVKHEGWRNLFDGLGLRLARKAMSAGIAWGIYEEIVKFVVVK